MTALVWLVSLAAVVLAALTLLTVILSWRHLRGVRALPDSGAAARVCILTACRGADPELEENLSSWIALGAQVQIGIADADDPALPLATALQQRHPDRVRVMLTGPVPPATNPKVHNLAALHPSAELLLVGDSNVRAPPDLLEQLVEPLRDPGVGATCALFVAHPPPGASLGTKLEGLLFSTAAFPPLAAAFRLFGHGNLIGKAMLVRRAALEQLGGWARFRGVLVEDGELGRALKKAGLRVHLVRRLVEVRLGAMTLRQLWEHEARWMMLHRVTAPLVPLAMLAANPWTMGLLALVLPGASWALALGAAHNLLIKIAPHLLTGGRARELYLLPFAELVLFAAALRVWFQRAVVWRGRRYRLGRGSRILPSLS